MGMASGAGNTLAIGRSIKPKGSSPDGLPPFLAADNLNPFISQELYQATGPIIFRTPRTGDTRGKSGTRALGYDAMLLPMVCEVYLNARDAGKTTRQQEHIVKACDLLMRGFARVGIIALVDEATGYQEYRAKEELRLILEEFMAKEIRPYAKKFPEEFFRQIYRLHGWPYKPGNAQRTPFIGHLINKYIYEQLPPPVLPELKRRNPMTEKGYRRWKHTQLLTPETGIPALDQQISNVVILMRISDDREDFEQKFERAFSKSYQPRLPLRIDVGPPQGTATADSAQ